MIMIMNPFKDFFGRDDAQKPAITRPGVAGHFLRGRLDALQGVAHVDPAVSGGIARGLQGLREWQARRPKVRRLVGW